MLTLENVTLYTIKNTYYKQRIKKIIKKQGKTFDENEKKMKILKKKKKRLH